MGEGIETSLAAGRIFNVPEWAALSAGSIAKFGETGWPPGLKRLLISPAPARPARLLPMTHTVALSTLASMPLSI
jgi:hypothetical protein